MPDIALIRKRLHKAIDEARRSANDRRAHLHEARKAFDEFLDARALPAFRSVAMVLKAEGLQWEVMTPSGEVRLSPERRRDDGIALTFDDLAQPPQPIVTITRNRGGRVLQSERQVKPGIVSATALSEDDVVDMLIEELRPWLE
jgi:hypothetical protein